MPARVEMHPCPGCGVRIPAWATSCLYCLVDPPQPVAPPQQPQQQEARSGSDHGLPYVVRNRER